MSAPFKPTTELPSNSSTQPESSVPATTSETSDGAGTAVRTKTDVEEAADRLYEERIEEEYAKREGGA